MKNIVAIICLLLSITACHSKQPTTKTVVTDSTSKKAKGIRYTCTMHPQVITTKPGTCPKCGMELVEKDDSK